MKNKWIMTLNDERWESNHYDEFDTEQDILDYIDSMSSRELLEIWEEEYGDEIIEEGDEVFTIYYGQVLEFVPSVDAENVLDNISENAYSEVGEYAERYLYDVPKEQIEDLEEKLNEVLHNWMKKYKHEPHFYTIGKERCILKKID